MQVSDFKPIPSTTRLYTPGYQCFSVKFGTFQQDQIAVAGGTNFGMRGPGRLSIFSTSNPSPLKTFDLPEGLYDVGWSEVNPNILVGALADGSVVLFDLTLPNGIGRIWKGIHGREVTSVEWNLVSKDSFISSSLDGTVKLWDARSLAVTKIFGHAAGSPVESVYEAVWNPRDGNLFATASSGQQTISLFDSRTPNGPVQSIPNAHQGDILCIDWNKYENFQVATGSVDQSIKVWDLRSPTAKIPLHRLSGHYRAVKRLRFSPFSPSQLVSVGFDMATRFWDLRSLNPAVLPANEDHTEFVTGISWSLDKPGVLVTCSWDDSCNLIQYPQHRAAVPLV